LKIAKLKKNYTAPSCSTLKFDGHLSFPYDFLEYNAGFFSQQV